jgi:S-adenosylmethionine:tRNA ribosyltransferase-isomerase
MNINLFDLKSYDYNLPENLIAQDPHIPYDECKLLLITKNNEKIALQDYIFKDIFDLIDKETILFFNNSKVIKARIPLNNVNITDED